MTCVVLEFWQIPAAAGTANHNLLGKYELDTLGVMEAPLVTVMAQSHGLLAVA